MPKQQPRKGRSTPLLRLSVLGSLLAVGLFGFTQTPAHSTSAVLEFEDPSLIVVYSVSDNDAQIIGQASSEEPMRKIKIRGPNGVVFHRIHFRDGDDLGQADFQFDTPEPLLDELMTAYPPGEYHFRGSTVDGSRLAGTVELSYDFLPPAAITFPLNDDSGIPTDGLVVLFTPPAEAEAIRLEVEDQEEEIALKVDLPGDTTSFDVPDGWLKPGTEYVLDIKVIAENGNQTVRDIRFVTAE